MTKAFIYKKILGLAVVLAVLFSITLPGRLIKVNLECESQVGECPKNISDKLNTYDGKSLTQVKKELSKDLKSDASVRDFSFQYKLPNILRVYVLVEKPLYALRDLGSGKIYQVDSAGKVILIVSSSNLPTVFTENVHYEIGNSVTAEELFSLKLIEGVFAMYRVNSSTKARDGLVVELPDQVKVIFPLQGDRDVLLGSLRTIYSKIQEDKESRIFSEIDLRFKNPVLR